MGRLGTLCRNGPYVNPMTMSKRNFTVNSNKSLEVKESKEMDKSQ